MVQLEWGGGRQKATEFELQSFGGGGSGLGAPCGRAGKLDEASGWTSPAFFRRQAANNLSTRVGAMEDAEGWGGGKGSRGPTPEPVQERPLVGHVDLRLPPVRLDHHLLRCTDT